MFYSAKGGGGGGGVQGNAKFVKKIILFISIFFIVCTYVCHQIIEHCQKSARIECLLISSYYLTCLSFVDLIVTVWESSLCGSCESSGKTVISRKKRCSLNIYL